jgi:hypothetical protein
MRSVLVPLLLCAAFLPGRVVAAGPTADAPRPATRERRTMRLALHAPADEAFPLFGPVREAEWAPDWSPEFLAPTPPAQVSDGAVFRTAGHGGRRSVWVMTTYDTVARHVAYVIVTPDLAAVELDIRVGADGDHASIADVVYRLTALGPDGEAYLRHWLEHFPDMRPHWEHALNQRFEGGPRAAH